MKTEAEINRAINQYGDMIRRICMVQLKNYADTEDIFQTVFMKYLQSHKKFDHEEHEKAWFIRVTLNACRDLLKSFYRKNTVSIEDLLPLESEITETQLNVLEALCSLPAKYRDVIYLHYYEGYALTDVAKLLKKKQNTVYSLAARGREMLKKLLGGENDAK